MVLLLVAFALVQAVILLTTGWWLYVHIRRKAGLEGPVWPDRHAHLDITEADRNHG